MATSDLAAPIANFEGPAVTPINVTAFLSCLAAIGIARKGLTTAKLTIFLLLLLFHLSCSYQYYVWSKTVTADSTIYYYDIYNLGSGPWAFGTTVVVKTCQTLKHLFNASYLDCFLLFQSFGFAGLMIIARIFDEVQDNVGVSDQRGAYILLFLPSVNFWTSAIGKDAPVFFGISLSLWAMLSFRRRLLVFCASLAIMVIFRAHIAFMAASALAITALFGSSVSFGQKLGLFIVACLGIWVTSTAVQSTLGVDATSLSSVASFIDKRNSIFATVGGATAVANVPFPLKMASLLFRPFFFDGGGGMGMIASVENIGVIAAFIYTLANWRDLAFLARNVSFIRFSLVFASIILIVLSLLYYNVGLGLRERVMAYPMAASILVGLWSIRRKKALAHSRPVQSGLMVQARPHRILPEV